VKKKQVKKLELNRETVRRLEEEEPLQVVVGGESHAICTGGTVPCSACGMTCV